MRKGVLFLMLTVVSVCSLFAQGGTGGIVGNDFSHSVEVFDPNGRTFVNNTGDIAGSPFFGDDWKDGRIVMNDNKVFHSTNCRLNLQEQQVHYLASQNVEMFIPAGMAKAVTFFADTSRNSRILADFQCGFPAIDEQGVNNFYQVLSRGKALLLLSRQKVITQEKDEFSGDIKKHFTTHENYYVFAGNTLQRIKKDKSFLPDLLTDKKEQLAAFIEKNKLKCKSTDDLKIVIDYYNTLP